MLNGVTAVMAKSAWSLLVTSLDVPHPPCGRPRVGEELRVRSGTFGGDFPLHIFKPFHDSEHYVALWYTKLPSFHPETKSAVYFCPARSVEILYGLIGFLLNLLMTITAGTVKL